MPAQTLINENHLTQTEDRVDVDDELLTEDLLIEDVSIDGMCGVY